MKKNIILTAAVWMILAVSAFALVSDASDQAGHKKAAPDDAQIQTEDIEMASESKKAAPDDAQMETEDTEMVSEPAEEKNAEQEQGMKLMIGDTQAEVIWEDNESVKELEALVSGDPLSIDMSMYGGFEQVGAIGSSLASNDVQTVTEPGDIVLYAGSQIVIFYGSNSWAYTRLGKITDRTAEEMAFLLGNGDVTITLSM